MAQATWEEEVYPDGHVETGHIKGVASQKCDGIVQQYASMGNMVEDTKLSSEFRDEVHETHS
jgi:(2Fe-2S) ferredoxin